MTERVKNYLGIAIIIAVLLFAVSAVSYVRSYARLAEPGSFRQFAVSAEGKSVVVPDVASFSFSVISEGNLDLASLQTQATAKANAAIKFLKDLGIKTEDVRTTGYNVNPRYQTSSCTRTSFGATTCPPPTIVGYTITQSTEVKIRNFELIGEALSGVIEHGANSTSGLSFVVDDPTAPESEARAEAIAKAKLKARAVAEAGDFRLGRLLSIEEGGFYPLPYKGYEAEFGRGGDAVSSQALPPVAVEAGSQEVMVNVTLRYEIE
jgi:hypothetical protein